MILSFGFSMEFGSKIPNTWRNVKIEIKKINFSKYFSLP